MLATTGNQTVGRRGSAARFQVPAGIPSLLSLVFGVPGCGRGGGALAGVWLLARLVRWIGSWGELVSLCRVAHGQQWATGDGQHKDDNDDNDKDLQTILLGRQPASDSARVALAACRIATRSGA